MRKRRSARRELAIFSENALMITAALTSLLLQIISFVTTWQGAEVYFSSAFPLAPLFFAAAVQSVVYFVANSIRNSPGAGKLIALLLALLCSNYFSFVGIYSAVDPPTVYLQRTYSSYSSELIAEAERLNAERNADSTAAIDRAVNSAISRYTELTSQKASLDSLAEQLSAVDGGGISSGMTAPSRWNYATYEDYAAAYQAYIAGLSQGTAAAENTEVQSLLGRYGLASEAELAERTAEITAEMSLIEGVIGASGSGFYSSAEQLRAEMLAGNRSAAERVFSLYERLTGERLEYAADEPEVSPQLPGYGELSDGRTPAAVREEMLRVISAACDTLNASGGEVSAENYPVENIYTLPLRSVFVDFSTVAAVSLALALLTDYLSLAAAVIYVRKKSVLTARDTVQAAGRDDSFFEQNIAGALQLGEFSAGGSYGSADERRLAERLAEYISRFSASDIAVEQGCALIASREAVREHELLTAFLCQCGYAKLLTAEEIGVLGGSADSDCVLLKTRFLMWANEKLAAQSGGRADSGKAV